MRRLTITLLATCLLGASAVPAIAQGPPPWFGGRVEMPEHGFAVTYPDDWVWFRLPVEDRQAAIDAVAAAAQPPIDDAVVQSLVGDGDSGVVGVWGYPPSLEDACGVSVHRDLQSLDAYESAERRRLAPVEFMYPEVTATDVALPVGEARRIDTPMYLDGEMVSDTASYAVLGDAGVLAIACTGLAAPPDRWLSFAETIEFLPVEDGPATAQVPDPTPGSQRLVFAEEGLAITVPADWQLVGEGHYPAGVVAWFGSADGTASCGVVMLQPGGTTLDEALYVVAPTGYWATLPDGYSAEVVQTAGGQAVQVTFSEAVDDLGLTYWNAVYLIPSDEGLYSVQCAVPIDGVIEAYEDWLSIAETFEFLPEEG